MRRIRAFGVFLYEFIIGDDPLIAVVVVLALATTAVIAQDGLTAWWVMPAAVVAALAFSVHRAARAAPPRGPEKQTVERDQQQ